MPQEIYVMIVSCPTCNVRIKVDDGRLAGKRITIRCKRCRQVFKTNIGPSVEPSDSRVLVAHCDEELCATIRDLFIRENIPCDICHDGHEALNSMEARPPAVALVDVALPGLYAFEVVEKVRRRPGLQDVKIILLSSVYNKAAYKRLPSSLYGADDYLEKHHISDQLIAKVRRLAGTGDFQGRPSTPLGVSADGAPDTAALQYRDEINAKILAAEEQEVNPATGGSPLDKAKRLARIIVSDIALYNGERVEEGIRNDTFFELLDAEIAEGRRLFDQRVPQELRAKRDLLQDAFDSFVAKRRSELA